MCEVTRSMSLREHSDSDFEIFRSFSLVFNAENGRFCYFFLSFWRGVLEVGPSPGVKYMQTNYHFLVFFLLHIGPYRITTGNLWLKTGIFQTVS